ncbi:MAG: dihydroxy-acid dehydratase [Actinomycetota bacterium]|nr:dihydroxy-acid dehydratase [Actinomycetota bacterium]
MSNEAGMQATERAERRSQEWFGAEGRSGMVYRSWLRNEGFGPHVFDGRPVIGIASTWSELSPCNAHLDRVADAVRRGVLLAGGFPLEFPTMSTGETLMRPTAMLFRNLLAMEAEELFRANPLDGLVLLSGCDKTTPGLLMAAASVDLPAIMVTGGPMLNGKFRGQDVGSGTHVWKFEAELKAGTMTPAEAFEAEGCMARSNGHCMTMGTASTMACMAEALGMQLSGAAAWPAVDMRRFEIAESSGRRIVEMVREDLRPSRILTRQAFENAIAANAAIGGSTNALIHLIALAGRAEVPLELADFDAIARKVPTLVDLMPSGRYLMEDFCYAGGLPAVLRELADAGLLHREALTVSGKSVGEEVASAPCYNREVIRSIADPFLEPDSASAVLFGNLCPDGAVIKQSAATPELMTHRGRALVFDSPEEYHARCDAEDFEVEASDILVIRYCGPKGYPGMPEVSNVALPRKLLAQGVRDMVRICDGRMSGTGFGTVVLHVAPEAALGGPLALVRTGDMIELDVPGRRLHLDVSDEELERRRAAWRSPLADDASGYRWLYREHVLQANHGADFNFLQGRRGHTVARDSH